MNNEETTLYLTALTALLQAISLIPRNPRNQTDADEKALGALSDAYYATHKYYDSLKDHSRDRSQEVDIANKWEQVGILMQKYDSTLSQQLSTKSRYWKEGATWSDKIIRDAGIGLERV